MSELTRRLSGGKLAMPTSGLRARMKCAVCADTLDVCPGHTALTDPEGARRLELHWDGNHILCHPLGCRARSKEQSGS